VKKLTGEARLEAIAGTHRRDSIGGCACGQVYPCHTLWLVDEVLRLKAAGDRLVDESRHMRDEYSEMDAAVAHWRSVTAEDT
jgi:hypothetical protein